MVASVEAAFFCWEKMGKERGLGKAKRRKILTKKRVATVFWG